MFIIRSEKELGLVKGWPIYLVVTKGHAGIYDDLSKFYIDCCSRGSSEFHKSTKKSVAACKKDIISYYAYHYPNDIIKSNVDITRKNVLYKITEEY